MRTAAPALLAALLLAARLGAAPASAPTGPAAEPPQRIAVLEFAAKGVEPHVASIVTGSATAALDGLGVFQVISAEDIKGMLSAEALKMAVGCDESSCLAEIAGAVGATYLVTGSVGQLGDAYQVSMTLIDQARAETLERVVRQDQVAVAALPELAALSVRQLVRSLLEAHQGSLELVVDEPGADIFIDDTLIGVSPLTAPLVLPQGPHRLKVAKTGFIAHRQDFEIRRDESTGVSLRLTPSAEFRQAYKATHGTLRTLAWVTGGVAALGLIGAGGASLLNLRQRDQAEQLLRDHSEVFGPDPSAPEILAPDSPLVADYRRLQSQSLASAIGAYAAVGLAAVSGVAAVILFVVGEDPDRYDR